MCCSRCGTYQPHSSFCYRWSSSRANGICGLGRTRIIGETVAADTDGGGLQSARLCAAKRAEQLAPLRAGLAAGQLVAKFDIVLARRNAEEARIRSRRAHLAA